VGDHTVSESQSITLRIAVKDVEAARKLAEQKGLPYQTYIKMLLHESLQRERKRPPGSDVDASRSEAADSV